MRLRLAVTIAALLVPLAACHRPPATATDHHETRSFAAAPGKLVRLDVRSLDAEVEVVAGETIEVDVRVASHSSSRAAARRWVERNTPVMDDSPSRLEISVPKRSGVSVVGFISTEGTVRVKLPAQCTLEIKTGSGDVTLSGGQAVLATPVRVETSSGDVTVEGGAREVLLDTSSGDISVSGAALAVLEASTSSGSVRLDSGAERAVVETSSGDAVLHGLGGDLSATSSSGDVESRWSRLRAGAKVRVETSSGDVTLQLPSQAALTGEIRTTNGTIQSDFAGEEDRRGRRFTLSGAAAAAEQAQNERTGAEVSVRTTSGDVSLLKAKARI